jgi:hypothetical protein
VRIAIKATLSLAAFVFSSLSAFGQAIPPGHIKGPAEGSMWVEVGTISPLEKGNVISSSGIHQGYDLYEKKSFSFTAFIAGGATFDTSHYVWNNQVSGSLGIQANAIVPHGVISVGGAYSVENRFLEHETYASPGYFVQDWFGWQMSSNDPQCKRCTGITYTEHRFPGSTWTSYGYTQPIERHNKILYGFVQQGVVVGHFFKHPQYPIISFAELTAGHSSQPFDWDNFYRPGIGVQIHMPRGLQIGTSFLYEERPISQTQAVGFSVFLKFASDWMLLGRRQ